MKVKSLIKIRTNKEGFGPDSIGNRVMKVFLRLTTDILVKIIQTIFGIRSELIEDERRCRPEGGRQNISIEWRPTTLLNKVIGELAEKRRTLVLILLEIRITPSSRNKSEG